MITFIVMSKDLYACCQRLKKGTPDQHDVILYSGSAVRCWWYWLAYHVEISNLIVKKL